MSKSYDENAKSLDELLIDSGVIENDNEIITEESTTKFWKEHLTFERFSK